MTIRKRTIEDDVELTEDQLDFGESISDEAESEDEDDDEDECEFDDDDDDDCLTTMMNNKEVRK